MPGHCNIQGARCVNTNSYRVVEDAENSIIIIVKSTATDLYGWFYFKRKM
jgi:hypothetical protein